jgi:hypothetical protein
MTDSTKETIGMERLFGFKNIQIDSRVDDDGIPWCSA